jgi:chromosome segregation ATPase
MAGENKQSNVGAHEMAEATQADALAATVTTAAVAAQAAVANAEQTAAQLQTAAAEHAAQLETLAAEHIEAQQDELQWLKTATAETAESLKAANSHLTTLAERQAATETMLQRALELLTPPASNPPEIPEAEPAAVAVEQTPEPHPQNAGAEGQKEAEANQQRARRPHTWI